MVRLKSVCVCDQDDIFFPGPRWTDWSEGRNWSRWIQGRPWCTSPLCAAVWFLCQCVIRSSVGLKTTSSVSSACVGGYGTTWTNGRPWTYGESESQSSELWVLCLTLIWKHIYENTHIHTGSTSSIWMAASIGTNCCFVPQGPAGMPGERGRVGPGGIAVRP